MAEEHTFHVLVFEDDDAFRRMVVQMLEDGGFAVHAVGDFPSLMRIVDGPEPIDLLLADIGMPEKTPHGLSAARSSQVRRRGLKVVYMTGGDAEQFALYKPNDVVLQKPFDRETLIKAIRAALAS